MSGFADFPLAKGLSSVVDPLIPGIIDGTGSNLLDQVTPVAAEDVADKLEIKTKEG